MVLAASFTLVALGAIIAVLGVLAVGGSDAFKLAFIVVGLVAVAIGGLMELAGRRGQAG